MEYTQVMYYNFFAVTTTTVGILLLLFFFFCGLIFTISERIKHTKTLPLPGHLQSFQHFHQKNACMI